MACTGPPEYPEISEARTMRAMAPGAMSVVARMEPRQRLLAELYYREGRSIAQIAHRLGTRRKPLPEGTVKTHLNRLRKTIRKEVLGLGALVELPHAPMLA